MSGVGTKRGRGEGVGDINEEDGTQLALSGSPRDRLPSTALDAAGAEPKSKKTKSDFSSLIHKDAKPGSLLRIKLKNIRNHSNLEVKFNHATNFITGLNGSGKSSILYGIKLALGWTPSKSDISIISSTSNGQASVELDIVNRGKSCWKGPDPKSAAPSIIRVIRKMTRPMGDDSSRGTFTSKFEIWKVDEDGVAHALFKDSKPAKDALEEIRLALNIHHENPIHIMDQETSKKFMMSKGEDMFKFFMEATSLQADFDEIANTVAKLRLTSQHLEQAKIDVDKRKRENDDTKAVYDKVKGIGELIAQIKEAKLLESWAEISEKMKQNDGVEAEIKKINNEILDPKTGLDFKINECDKMKEKCLKEIQEQEKKHADIQGVIDKAQKEIDVLEGQIREASEPVEKRKAQIRRAEEEAAKQEKKAEKLRDQLSDLIESIENRRNMSKTAERAKAMDAATAQLKSSSEESKAAKIRMQEAEESETKLKRKMDDANSEFVIAKQRRDELDETVKASAVFDDSDGLNSFKNSNKPGPKDIYRIRGLIDGCDDWKVKPVGPIGAFVRVKEQAFVRPFESKCHFDVFLVDNGDDLQKLNILCKTAGLMHSLKTCRRSAPRKDSFKEADFHKPHGVKTFADILSFENDWVAFAVYDDFSPNETVLAKDEADGIRKIQERDGRGKVVGMRPGIKRAITEDMREVKVAPGGALKNITIKTPKIDSDRPLIRGPSKEAANDDLKARLDQAEKYIKRQERIVSDTEFSHQTAKKEAEKAKKALKLAETHVQNAKQALETAKKMPEDEEDEDEENDNAQKETYELRIQEAVYAAVTCREKVVALRGEIDEEEKNIDELKKKLGDYALLLNSPEVEAATAIIEENQKKISQCESLQTKFRDKRAALKEKRDAEIEKSNALRELREELIEKARLATGKDSLEMVKRDKDWLENTQLARAHIKGLEKKLEQRKKSHGNVDFEEIRKAYESATTKYLAEKKKYESTTTQHESLKQLKAQKVNGFKALRDECIKDVSLDFTDRMKAKGHMTSIDFKHGGKSGDYEGEENEGTIEIKTIMDAMQRGEVDKDPRKKGRSAGSYSGGEKSFTGNCLLSSIAKAAKPPFRCVDEFDVYQDETKRRQMLMSLVQDAKEKDADGFYTQHILLTPHDISASVAPSDTLIILRLADPVRN
jgi:structural maintenance of chromosomes protein 6